jgi:hypothetical protein
MLATDGIRDFAADPEIGVDTGVVEELVRQRDGASTWRKTVSPLDLPHNLSEKQQDMRPVQYRGSGMKINLISFFSPVWRIGFNRNTTPGSSC